MDVLAHGLWGGALFGQKAAGSWKWAFLFGVMPDVVAFGPAIAAGILTGGAEMWARPGPPPPASFPGYVFSLYNITHSLVIWGVALSLAWYLKRGMPLILGAWGLHILCDIPLHSIRYFPTPYLWPFPTPFHDGTPWGRPGFILANYSFLIAVYLLLAFVRLRRKGFLRSPRIGEG